MKKKTCIGRNPQAADFLMHITLDLQSKSTTGWFKTVVSLGIKE